MKRKIEAPEEEEVARKMARIEEVNSDNTENAVKHYNNESTSVVLQSYVLNDLKALEKKWNLRNGEPINVSDEAKDGSNICVVLKTSLFEAVKNNLLQVIKTDPDIEKAEITRTTKAKSNSGKADVEYIAKIYLNKGDNKHQIILTCYTTTCQIMLQKRGKHTKFPELGGRFVPKFFMEYYIVPFAQKMLETHQNLDDVILSSSLQGNGQIAPQ